MIQKCKHILLSLLVCLLYPIALVAAPLKQQEQIIPIETNDIGLYLYVNKKGEVYQQHFGKRIKDKENVLRISKITSFPAIIGRQAYSTFGTGNVNEVALQAKHADGNLTSVLVYENHSSRELSANITETTLTLKDSYYPFYVTLKYKAYQKENVLDCSVSIWHEESAPVVLQANASNYLFINAQQYWFTHFYGAATSEMKIIEEKLNNGIKTIESKKGVRASQTEHPSFIVSLNQPAQEESGEVIMGSLAWNNNYQLRFQVDNHNNLHILSGMNDFMSDYYLKPHTRFETPSLILTYSDSGKGQAGRNIHHWARNYGIRDGNTIRPVVLNSWEGVYFSCDEENILAMIDDAASLGAEVFVLDDGWFGNTYDRNWAQGSLGDWQVNREKFPRGLQPLIDRAHQQGIKFGLWVEPEMVNPKSELADNHPEWLVTGKNREILLGRNQLILDMTNPEVANFVYQSVAKQLTDYPNIAYIKWDANRHMMNFGSNYLDDNEQSNFWYDYAKALQGVYSRLALDFPKVIFQACASGGGRSDYGTLQYHHEFWASDNTDPRSRIFINWGYSHLFPANAIASHVSHSPNHQTGNITPIKFRFDVSMSQRLGIELQPNKLTEKELDWTKKAVAAYKNFREVVQFGDLYRLISPYENDRAALMYVDEAQDKAILFVYVLEYHYGSQYALIKMTGLDPNKKYKLKEILPIITEPDKFGLGGGKEKLAFRGNGQVFTGDFLMNHGIEITHRYTNESAVIEIQAIK